MTVLNGRGMLLRKLERRERELRRLVSDEQEQLDADRAIDFAERIGDDADLADTRVRAPVTDRLIDRHVREIADVALARDRVANGTFGVCADCGAAIDRRRLAVLPAATRCTACQSLRERSAAAR